MFSDLTKDQEDIIEQILDYLKENQPEVLSSNFDPTEEFDENSSTEDEDDDNQKRKRSRSKKKKSSFEDDLDDDLDDDDDDDLDDLLDD